MREKMHMCVADRQLAPRRLWHALSIASGESLLHGSSTLYGPPAAGNQAHQKQDQEDHKTDLRDTSRGGGNATEPENGRENCDYQKYPGVPEHVFPSTLGGRYWRRN